MLLQPGRKVQVGSSRIPQFVSGYPNNDKTNLTDTMTDPCFRFAVYCVGSNKRLAADLAIRFNKSDVLESSYDLQRQVAALYGVESHQCIKITLGSPAGPQLTPLLRSLDTALNEIFKKVWQDAQLRKAAVSAWSALQPDKVNTVYATQHRPSAVVVDQLVVAYNSGYVSHVYNGLPRATLCDPAVFLTANTLVCMLDVPDELRSNKKLALYSFQLNKRWNRPYLCNLGLLDMDALQDDDEVVLAAVDCNSHKEFYWASPRLKADKAFVLKVVGVNGLCIADAAADLKRDKDVALAAVRQAKEAVKYLCAELQEDKDIVAACANNK
jgi:hypothetical protein